jgi:signal transduction histidine kinase/CheY-like chemotaxis protein
MSEAALVPPRAASAAGAPGARVSFVVVAGPAGNLPPCARRHPPGADAPLHAEALRSVRCAAPFLFVGFATGLVILLLALDASRWRGAWFLLALACGSAWAATLAPPSHWLAARRAGRSPVLAQALVIAVLLVLALAPWLPGPLAPPPQRVLLVLGLVTVAITGVSALAPLRGPSGLAAALPLSAAGAEALRPGGSQALALVAVLLAFGVALLGWTQRRQWLRAARTALERQARLRELEAERDAAMRADQEKSRFLAIASHDLRQPMHALGLFAGTLERRLQGSSEETLVHNLVRSIDGLDRSFNVMLDISRLDAGTIEPNLQQFPLRDVFRRLHMHFAGQAEQAGLGLRFSPGGKSVTSDPQLLERLLGNLIQNAIKYTEQGGIVVVARTTSAYVNVEVWDTGVGIPPAELPRIFDEFYQVGQGGRARDRGFGMGLAIVKRLAELLGLRLVVASRPGRGTLFRVGIPVGAAPELQDFPAAADTLPMPQPAAQPRTVLIVDDEAPIREGLGLLLEEWGYQAVAAATAEEAARVARGLEAPLDLIVSDLHLGDGPDGIEAIEAVRRACGLDVPAILVTGDTSPQELRRATDSGHPVLFKPVQARKLLNAVRGHIP